MVSRGVTQRKEGYELQVVYKVKYNSDESLEYYKARLVAKEFTQKEGVDYTVTFSSVSKMVTVQTVIATAPSFNWPIWQVDVNNAFL